MVRKKFKLDENEYKEFTNRIMVKSKVKIIFLTGLIVFVAASAFSYKDGFQKAIINGVTLFTAYILIVFIGLFVFAPLFTRKAYTKNKVDQISFDYEILETGIKQNKNMFLYDSFRNVYEGKYSYFLYLKDKQVILLPKRLFDKEEDLALRKLLSEKIKDIKFKNTNKS